jgi:hypothetical protein
VTEKSARVASASHRDAVSSAARTKRLNLSPKISHPTIAQPKGDFAMRFMVIVKATAESEKEGALPDPQVMADMGKYNEELIKAGILLALDAGDSEVEIRQVFEMEEFAPILSDEVIQHKKRLRAQLVGQAKK